MARFAYFSMTVLFAFTTLINVGAAPVYMKRAVTQTADNFKQLDYAQFQISDGVGGNAAAEANAVFVDPFANTDLSTVSSDVLNALDAMAKAAESAETADFDPAIAAASGAQADALQVGKIKNKVLKLTGEVQVLNVKIAQAKAAGTDTSDLESSLATEQTKLTTDIATDKASVGQTSQGVSDSSPSSSSSGGAASASATSADTATSASESPSTTAAETAAAKAKKTKATSKAALIAKASATVSAVNSNATAAPAVTQSAANFKELDYLQFQISDGVGGNAAAEANAVFVDPFANTDLSTVSSDVLNALDAMAKAAESAETAVFDPAISAASGADAAALQVGKIKNKVLKLTGEVQVLNVKIAQAQAAGKSTSDLESSLATEQTKLTTDIATDKTSAGQASKGVA